MGLKKNKKKNDCIVLGVALLTDLFPIPDNNYPLGHVMWRFFSALFSVLGTRLLDLLPRPTCIQFN